MWISKKRYDEIINRTALLDEKLDKIKVLLTEVNNRTKNNYILLSEQIEHFQSEFKQSVMPVIDMGPTKPFKPKDKQLYDEEMLKDEPLNVHIG
ncbi:MAG: hypothetical protein ACFFDN_05185 [Candidatus Hodarchaeota archaeon]